MGEGGSGLFPILDSEAVEAAEAGKQQHEERQVWTQACEPRPSGHGSGTGKNGTDGELPAEPAADAESREVHDCEVEHRGEEEQGILAPCGSAHAGENQPEKRERGGGCGEQERAPMARMEEVPLTEMIAARCIEAVEETIGDVEEPCSDAENGEAGARRVDVRGEGEAPRPEDGDRGSIEAEQVPVNRDGEKARTGSLADDQDWSGESHNSIVENRW